MRRPSVARRSALGISVLWQGHNTLFPWAGLQIGLNQLARLFTPNYSFANRRCTYYPLSHTSSIPPNSVIKN